jgi:hypothetical protein
MIEFICHFAGAFIMTCFVSDSIYQLNKFGRVLVPSWEVIFIVTLMLV